MDRPRRGARASARSLAALAALAALVVLVGACSPTAPASGGATTADAGGTAGPAATGSPAAVAPTPTAWPGNVQDAIIALGKLDEQMANAAQAMDDAVAAKDVAALSAASRGLVDLVDGYAEHVRTAQGYPGTQAVGDTFAAALAQIRAGAQAIVDGVAAGDATAVDAGVSDLGAGIATYGLARKDLGPLLEQAISMKKKYVK